MKILDSKKKHMSLQTAIDTVANTSKVTDTSVVLLLEASAVLHSHYNRIKDSLIAVDNQLLKFAKNKKENLSYNSKNYNLSYSEETFDKIEYNSDLLKEDLGLKIIPEKNGTTFKVVIDNKENWDIFKTLNVQINPIVVKEKIASGELDTKYENIKTTKKYVVTEK